MAGNTVGLTRGWQPGESGNPSGRPKGFGRLIREQTLEGAELVAFALAMVRNKRMRIDRRFSAVQWLADRGWGKAIQATEISGPEGAPMLFVPWAPVSEIKDDPDQD